MKHFARWLFICMMLGIALVGTSLRSPSTHAAGCLSTEYPTFGYDMQRTSWNSQECILAGALPAVQWFNPYAGVTFADREGVSVYKDQAFVGQVNQMLAYNRFTGAINWSFATGAPLVGAATIYQNQLFFGSPDTRLYSLKPTGGVLWVASVGVPISSTPAGFDKLVIVSMDDGAVYAFDVLTGALVWRTPVLGKSVSSPAIFDKKVYVSALLGTSPDISAVYALDALTGTPLWRSAVVKGALTVPVLANKQVYVGADDVSASVFSFDPWTGGTNWLAAPGGEPVRGKPAADGNQLYLVGAFTRKLYGLNAFSGATNWSNMPPPGFFPVYPQASPTVANGIVYVGAQSSVSTGFIYAFKISGGFIWGLQIHGETRSPVTVVNGWLYATTYDGSTSIIYGIK